MARQKRFPTPIGFVKQKDGTFRRKGAWFGEALKYFAVLEFSATGETVQDRDSYVARLKHPDGRLVQIVQTRFETRINTVEGIPK